MGIDFLIASLGATWFLSSQEKKKQRRREMAAKAAYEASVDCQISAKQYLTTKNYNRSRQHDLGLLARSAIREDRGEFIQLLGRPYHKSDVAIERAIQAIADKEGWTYYDEFQLQFDPEYCRISGLTLPTKEMMNANASRENARRKNEVLWAEWVANNPRCFDIDVSPEYYESEEKFTQGIEAAYHNWRKTVHDFYGVDVYRYDTKTAYRQALNDRKKELLDYQEAMVTLGVKTDVGRDMFCRTINTLTDIIDNRPTEVPPDLFFYIVYLNRCIPYFGGTASAWELEHFQVLRVKARLHGLDLDDILEKAEVGTLLPKGAKVLKNYYLSWYILTGEGNLYTLRPSSHYYQKHGFTLDDFAKKCGKTPGYYFAPPMKGLPNK